MPTHIFPSKVNKIASFSADDRILLGEGLFETIRVEQNRPCYSGLHWQRMSAAAKLLELPFDVSQETWLAQLLRCIEIAKIRTGGIKVILSGGRAVRGLAARGETSCLSFETFSYLHQDKALRLISADWLRDAKNPVYQLKSVNYLESILARRKALERGADDALFFNLERHATETTTANLFIIKDNHVFTPTLTSGLLGGVTRGRLLCLCRDSGIACTETAIDSAMISEADTAFVTNSLQGIQSIASFDAHPLPVQHPLVASLRDLLANDSAIYSTMSCFKGKC